MDNLDLKPCTLDFTTCIPKCMELDMNKALLEMLEVAWLEYPFRINSGFRTPEWERKHSRSGTSAHCLGKAVDINTPDSRTRWYVVRALLDAGFTRIGFGKNHVHVDIDVCKTRPDRCIFLE